MSILEEYEKRMKLSPLTSQEILSLVEDAEAFLGGAEVSKELRAIDETPRVVVWLHDRLQAVYAALDNPKAPVEARCAWCFRAGPQTDEAWRALPKMNLDDSAAHSAVCEHNPLVARNRMLEAREQEHLALRARINDLEATSADLQGRGLSADERGLRDKIRALLKGDKTAGELRRALGELVR